MSAKISGKIKNKIKFTNYKILPLLFGDHDRNIARIEQKLTVSIGCFGNEVEVRGSEKNVNQALATIETLYKKLNEEGESDCIDFEIIDAAIEWILNSTDENGKPDLAGFDNQFGRLETWKRRIIPRSPSQQAYVKALLKSDISLGVGPAGTGKTYLAIAVAVSLLKKRQVERLILSRPAVEAGERLGFLPGDMKEKIETYLRPLYDALFDMMPSENVERMIENGQIEVAPLAFMRGRTLANSFVILDEAQNTTPAQMKMFLTRMGENSSICVTGDLSQIDLPPNIKSGLKDAIEVLEKISGISIIRFTGNDIIRHPMVTRIVNAYDKREGNHLYEVPAE